MRGVGVVGAGRVVEADGRLVVTLVDVHFAVHSAETRPASSSHINVLELD